MRPLAVWTVAIALLAASCGTDGGERVEGGDDTGSPVKMSPVTTSPVTSSPATTSPVASETPSTTTTTRSEESGSATTRVEAGSGGDEGTTTTVTTQPPKGGIVKPIQPVDPHEEGIVAAAVVDLAARLGVDRSIVVIVSVEEVTWPDGSIGCPQPGMSYTQALVNGSLVVLQIDGVDYEYHSGGGRDLFYCANPTPPVPGEHSET